MRIRLSSVQQYTFCEGHVAHGVTARVRIWTLAEDFTIRFPDDASGEVATELIAALDDYYFARA